MTYNNQINFVSKNSFYPKSGPEFRPIFEFNKNHNDFESNDELFPNICPTILTNNNIDFAPDFFKQK